MTKYRIFLAVCILALVFATFYVPWKNERGEGTPTTISDMNSIFLAMNYYLENLGPLPIGTEEIFRALRGDNTENLIILENTDGSIEKMLDPWGYPYQIRVDTDGSMRIISGGPNGVIGDQDDILRKSEQ